MAISDIFKISEYQKTIQNLKSKIDELQSEIDSLQNFIHSRLPFFEITSLPAFNNFEDLQELWYKCWGDLNHNDPHKLVRQERACKAPLTPLYLDVKKGVAHFRGTERDYKTTLISCECMDFQRHALPCKHMYRLAYELDIFMLNETVEVVPEPNKLLHQNELDLLLRRLSKNDRELISDISYEPNIVRRTDVRRLLNLELIVISTDKHFLLNYYKRDELFTMLPSDALVKKSCRKPDLIELIISTYPNVITEIEKLTIPVELSPYIIRFKNYIQNY